MEERKHIDTEAGDRIIESADFIREYHRVLQSKLGHQIIEPRQIRDKGPLPADYLKRTRWELYPRLDGVSRYYHNKTRMVLIDGVPAPTGEQLEMITLGLDSLKVFIEASGYHYEEKPALLAFYPGNYQSEKYGGFSGGDAVQVDVSGEKRNIWICTGEPTEDNIPAMIHEAGHAVKEEDLSSSMEPAIKVQSNQLHPLLDEGLMNLLMAFTATNFDDAKYNDISYSLPGSLNWNLQLFMVNDTFSGKALTSKYGMGLTIPKEDILQRGFSSTYFNLVRRIMSVAETGEEDERLLDDIANGTNFRKPAHHKPDAPLYFNSQDQAIKLCYSFGTALILELAQAAGNLHWARNLEIDTTYEYSDSPNGDIDSWKIITDRQEFSGLDKQSFMAAVCRRLVAGTNDAALIYGFAQPSDFLTDWLKEYKRGIDGEITPKEWQLYDMDEMQSRLIRANVRRIPGSFNRHRIEAWWDLDKYRAALTEY